ncbi:hypothetical protein PR202_gb10392 [Eleusine coracana subsp. coracana]|uniref:mannan endo-1,4-beta-mannosidase n=1 Tax=Eleusine coracana subsp. coracana TaxID=191504 RepID=A0AAV5EKE9_ELECO|nr:hypothetical protein PR202_gb10392 [Eleusine coracana subsp. coracana]
MVILIRPRLLLATIINLFLTSAAVPVPPWLGHDEKRSGGGGFVGVDGMQFVANDRTTVYLSGFNAYWLMTTASDPAQRAKVLAAFRQASAHGLNLARTWAFSDGGDKPLQSSPGVYDEAMFKGLDFVVAQARRHGVYLLLCLTNNFHDFGGKRQYVQWARDAADDDDDDLVITTAAAADDDFFNSTVVKGYYKNHVKTVLTRVNTFTGVAYKDDPTIFAWELMNEPRCDADPTGAMVQAWVEEMAPYVKSIDSNHLVTVGLEGFYGLGLHESKALNPWAIYYGTNYIDTHRAQGVDLATIHLYPDLWLWGATPAQQAAFFRNWTAAHARDTQRYLRMPLLVTEYGKFLLRWDQDQGANRSQRERDYFLAMVLDAIYDSASNGGPLVGGAFWQLLDDGMDALRDGYEIILPQDRQAATIIRNHSRQLAQLNGQDRRRRRYRSTSRDRKIRVGSSSSSAGDADTPPPRFPLISLARFVSVFRQISSFFF